MTGTHPAFSRGEVAADIESGGTETLGPAGRSPQEATGKLTVGAIYGEYHIRGVAGKGGMGMVYIARDRRLGRDVAIKVLFHLKGRAGAGVASPLLDEARHQVRVQHPHICTVHAVVELDGNPSLVMQYVPGGMTLAGCTKAGLSNRQIVELTHQVAEALHAAHEQGVIHGDIKPGNVLVDCSGERPRAYLSDFGLAVRAPSGGSPGRSTVAGGTLGYMAPEQACRKAVDARSDVFSLGATLYAALCGHPPVDPEEQQERPGRCAVIPLSERLSDVHWELEAVIMKCLERDPRHRYGSARELADELERWLEREPVHAVRKSLRGRVRVLWHRNRQAVAAAAVVLAAAAAAGSVWIWEARHGRLRAAAERVVEEELGRIRQQLQLEVLMPFHDVAAAQERLLERVHAMTSWELRWGRAGRPAVLAGMARGYLELGRWQEAVRLLEDARKNGRSDPDLDQAWGAALLHRFTIEARRIESLLRGHERAVELARLERSLLGPAMAALKQAPQPLEVVVERSLADGRPQAALEAIGRVPDPRPPPYLLADLRGEIWTWIGRRRSERGETEAARGALEKARSFFFEAAEVARSDPRAHRGLCSTSTDLLWLAIQSGDAEEVARLTPRARVDCERARRVDSSSPQGWSGLALLDLRLSEFRQYVRRPTGLPGEEELLRRAVSEARRSIAMEPADPFARMVAVAALRRLSDGAVAKREEDPGRWIGEALEEARGLVRAAPDSAVAVHLLGAVQRTVADVVCSHFPDSAPMPCREAPAAAAATLRRAVALDPSYALAWKDLAYVHEITGLRQGDLEPGPALGHLVRAVAAASRALELKPCYYDALDNLAQSLEGVGWWVAGRGGDLRPWIENAARVFRQDFRCAPSRPYAIVNGAGIWLKAAWFRVMTGTSPRRELEEVETVLATAPQRRWERWWARRVKVIRAEASLVRAADRIRRGLDATRELRRARAGLPPCAFPSFCEDSARLAYLEALGAFRDGRSPSAAAARCRAAEEWGWASLERGLWAGFMPLWTGRVSPAADVVEARWLLAHGKDPATPLHHLERCVRLLSRTSSDDSAFLWMVRADLASVRALAARDPRSRTGRHAEVRRCAERAVALNAHLRYELGDLLEGPPPR